MWKETPEGIILSVKVIPNAHRSEIVGIENDELKIRLAAIPDKGKANDELIRFLAKIFNVSKSQVTLIHGATSRHKKICITRIGIEQFSSLLSKQIM